jgi:AcrR family transcriptional regulator
VSLTAKGRATRARIVEGAAEVVRDLGVAAATLDDVRSRTGTSKSQLFHYFPGGKEDLLLAVVRYEAGRVLDDQEPHLSGLDSWEAWYRWRDAVVERYEKQGDYCPLASLFLHAGYVTPAARAVVAELLRTWQASIAAGLRALQAGGRLPAAFEVDQAAAALLAGIQGGVTIMLATGDSAQLRAALDWGIAQLRAAGEAAADARDDQRASSGAQFRTAGA